MKKIFPYPLCVLVSVLLGSPVFAAEGGFVAASPAAPGGFSGPGTAPVTVQDAASMRDDANITLRGNIVRHLGKDKYLFQDGTGTIRVEIDKREWNGQTITPVDMVEIHGEVDKDWNSVEIEVDRIVRISQ